MLSQNDVIAPWLRLVNSHLKLLPTSILDIYTVFNHIDMLSMGIQYQPYPVIPTLLGSEFWGSMSYVDLRYHYVMVEADSRLKLLPASILDIYKVYEQSVVMSMGMHISSLTQLYPPYYLAQIVGYLVICGDFLCRADD
jgi:hypothetical protein